MFLSTVLYISNNISSIRSSILFSDRLVVLVTLVFILNLGILVYHQASAFIESIIENSLFIPSSLLTSIYLNLADSMFNRFLLCENILILSSLLLGNISSHYSSSSSSTHRWPIKRITSILKLSSIYWILNP